PVLPRTCRIRPQSESRSDHRLEPLFDNMRVPAKGGARPSYRVSPEENNLPLASESTHVRDSSRFRGRAVAVYEIPSDVPNDPTHEQAILRQRACDRRCRVGRFSGFAQPWLHTPWTAREGSGALDLTVGRLPVAGGAEPSDRRIPRTHPLYS